jgi:hypothetical protein
VLCRSRIDFLISNIRLREVRDMAGASRLLSSTCQDAIKPAQRVHVRAPNPAPVTGCTGSGHACCKRSVIEEVGSIAGCFGVDSVDPEMS